MGEQKPTKNHPHFLSELMMILGGPKDFDKEKIELLVFGGGNPTKWKENVRGLPQFINDVRVKHEFDLIHPK